MNSIRFGDGNRFGSIFPSPLSTHRHRSASTSSPCRPLRRSSLTQSI